MAIENQVENPWDNLYWFLRILINTDKYGGIGANSRIMREIAAEIHKIITSRENENADVKFQSLVQGVKDIIFHNRKPGTAKYRAFELLCHDLFEKMFSIKDFEVLALTCEKVLAPINEALKRIPGDDRFFVESVAKTILDTKGVNGLANLINILDDLGSKGCLSVERKEIVESFGILRTSIHPFLNEKESDIVLTAFCQEFERRVGQKRKGRAGRGVEGTTSLIFDYFGIKATHAPEHFTTGLEIDKWVKTKDGWIIGISCKRTLRERWKQAYTTDLNLLNRHKIRELWHVVTYDNDLSDEKITEIGSHRAILYLPDDSPRLKYALTHPGMKDYVRPMTGFIDDLKRLTL